MNKETKHLPDHFALQSPLHSTMRMLASLLFADLTPQHYCGMFREGGERTETRLAKRVAIGMGEEYG